MNRIIIFFLLLTSACQPVKEEAPNIDTPSEVTAFSLPFTWELNQEELIGDTVITIESEFLFKK